MAFQRTTRIIAIALASGALAWPIHSHADLEVVEQFAEVITGLRANGQEVVPRFEAADSSLFDEFAQIDSNTLNGSSYDLQTAFIVTRGDGEVRVQGDTAYSAVSSATDNSFANVNGEFSILFEVTDTPLPFRFDVELNLASGGLGFGGRFAAILDQLVGNDSARLIDFGRLCAPGSSKSAAEERDAHEKGVPVDFDLAFSCGDSTHSKQVVLQPGLYAFRVIESVEKTSGESGSLVSSWTMTVGGPVDCDLTWNVSDGAMGVAASWTPQRVPADSGDGCDNLVFDRAGSYVATMETLSANSLRLTTGSPAFTGTRLNLGGLGGKPALSIGDGGMLQLNGGRFDLPSGGGVVIGRGGGSGDQSGLSLAGATASLTQASTGSIVVGDNQSGVLNVGTGAQMNGGALVVGETAAGEVHVTGASGSDRSTLAISEDVTVGKGAQGTLTVTEGALFGAFGDLFVGLSGPGGASANTQDAQGNPATISAVDVHIGSEEVGEALLTIGPGGRLESARLFVGTVLGDGAAFIDGASGGKADPEGANAVVSGDVNVGGVGGGLLNVTGDALLQIGTPAAGNALNIAVSSEQAGAVELEGFPQETPELDIRGDLNLGTDGQASLSVFSALASATGTMTFINGDVAVSSKTEDAFRSHLVVDGGATIAGPGDGGGTVMTLDAGLFEVKQSLDVASGRLTATGFLSSGLVDPNAPLESSAALVKVLDLLSVGTIDPTIQGDARLRLQNGAVADAGELIIRSGEVALLTAQGVARPTTLQSFFGISVGNALAVSERIGTLRILGESFVQAADGIVVKATGRVVFTRGAVFDRPRVEAGGKVERLRGAGFKGTGGAPVMEGGLTLEDGGLLVINADAGAEPNLVINGNADLAGDLEVTFPNEKALLAGAVFNLIEIIGAKIGDFGELRFPTRSDDFEGAVTFENGQLVLEVITPGVAVIAPGATDVNGDSSVDAVDVQLVINAALGNDIGPAFNADANNDGQVNAVDIQLVINAALGLV